MLVVVDGDGAGLAARHGDRNDFLSEIASRRWPCRRAAASAARTHPDRRARPGTPAATFSPVSGMESTPYCCLHQRIDEAPADGGVEDFGRARERFRGLAHDERRARHRLDAAGNGEIDFTGADGARGGADRIHARGAQAVQRACREPESGRPASSSGHAGDVAVVFTGLVGAAEDDFLERRPNPSSGCAPSAP